MQAMQVEQVSKVYRIYPKPQDRLKEMLLGRFGHRYSRDFWALHDVSFELARGERLGVIGRNGSGKSTLLQILAGTLAPTTGRIDIQGRVAALLELGSGFNPDYTGRENVYLNASILGLSRDQIDARFDDIAAFADIGDFLDQPVKTYSSGMFVRLAFAVVTSVDADVLLIDEALAVGDVFFTQKCYRHLHGLIDRGVAIVLVTHDTTAVSQFCSSVLLLDRGQTRFHGDTVGGVRTYFALQRSGAPILAPPPEESAASVSNSTSARASLSAPASRDAGDKPIMAGAMPAWPSPEAFLPLDRLVPIGTGARCTAVALCDESGQPCQLFEVGETALCYFEFLLEQDMQMPVVGLELFNARSVVVHGRNSLQEHVAGPRTVPAGARIRACRRVKLDIAPDDYTFALGLASIAAHDAELSATMPYPALAECMQTLLVVKDAGAFTVRARSGGQALPFHGICDLAGETTFAVTPAPDTPAPIASSPVVAGRAEASVKG